MITTYSMVGRSRSTISVFLKRHCRPLFRSSPLASVSWGCSAGAGSGGPPLAFPPDRKHRLVLERPPRGGLSVSARPPSVIARYARRIDRAKTPFIHHRRPNNFQRLVPAFGQRRPVVTEGARGRVQRKAGWDRLGGFSKSECLLHN